MIVCVYKGEKERKFERRLSAVIKNLVKGSSKIGFKGYVIRVEDY